MSQPSLALFRLSRWLPSSAALVALTLGLVHGSAHADLWAYVDAQGVTHFAAEQIDARYTLFYKGSEAAQLNLTAESRLGSLPKAEGGVGLRATGKPQPAFSVPKRFAAVDDSKAYKAVQKHMQAAAKTHAVDYELIKAVIAAESGFDSTAVSPKGAVGLMQLLPTTAEMHGVSADKAARKDRKGNVIAAQSVEQKLTDPKTNIFAGVRYLSYLLKLFKGDTALAVAAYNAGEGAVQRAGNKVPNYKETQGYVKTVMGLYGVFKPGASVLAAQGGRATPAAAPALSRAGGRVRIELPGTPTSPGRAAPADATRVAAPAPPPAAAPAPEAAAAYVPVAWRQPAPDPLATSALE